MELTLVGMPRLQLHPAQLMRAATLGIIAGAAGLLVGWPAAAFTASVLAASVIIVWRRPRLRLVALFMVGCAVVLLRGPALPPQPPVDFVGPQVFEARVAAAPRPGDKVVRYNVVVKGGYRVVLTAWPIPLFSYGDLLRVDCSNVTQTSFRPYLSKGIWRECAFPDLAVVGVAQPTLTSTLLRVRSVVRDELRQKLPEPYASLATGMLWGDDAGLPKGLAQAFRRTGTSHLTAVSGYNVMVLTEMMFWVLIALGLWRKPASLAVLVAVGLFVLFTGAEPAVVRAGLMGSLLVVARLVGRKADDVNILLVAAAAILLFAPYLIIDLGFQLSFAAMAGLMFVAPRLTSQLKFLPKSVGLREAAAQTLAATLTTLPVILLRLGQVSFLAPLANLAITPAVVFIYLLGLMLIPVAFVSAVAAAPIAAGLSLVLAYVVWVVEALASLPWAAASSSAAVWLAIIVAYGGLSWWLKPKKISKLTP